MYKCLIDDREFETEAQLTSYISKTLKVKQADYFHEYIPRKDLLTGKLLEFKSKEFYMYSLFASRENLVAYLKKSPSESVIQECIKLRAEVKKLKYAPSTVEARTSILPTPVLVQRLGFSYNDICEAIGLQTKYDYEDINLEYETGPISITIDTREQKPLRLKGEITNEKLDVGDYTCTSHYKGVFVERKSLSDFCSTMSVGYERFRRELQRAQAMSGHIVVCVEENISQLPLIGKTERTSHTKASPEFYMSRMKSLCQEFPNAQFLFVNGRMQMTEIVEKILRMKNDVRRLDLQFLFDTSQL